MLEPPVKSIDNTRINNILRNHPQLGRTLAYAVALPTILSPKKSKKESSGSQYDPQGEEDLTEEAEPLPSNSTPFHDSSAVKVLLTYLVWNC